MIKSNSKKNCLGNTACTVAISYAPSISSGVIDSACPWCRIRIEFNWFSRMLSCCFEKPGNRIPRIEATFFINISTCSGSYSPSVFTRIAREDHSAARTNSQIKRNDRQGHQPHQLLIFKHQLIIDILTGL